MTMTDWLCAAYFVWCFVGACIFWIAVIYGIFFLILLN